MVCGWTISTGYLFRCCCLCSTKLTDVFSLPPPAVTGLWCGGEELLWNDRWCFGWESSLIPIHPATQRGTHTHTHTRNILTDESTNLEQDLVSIATGALEAVLRQCSVLEEWARSDCSQQSDCLDQLLSAHIKSVTLFCCHSITTSPFFFYFSWMLECGVPPAHPSESEGAGAPEGAGAGGVGRRHSRGGTDSQQQALRRQCWYVHPCAQDWLSLVSY